MLAKKTNKKKSESLIFPAILIILGVAIVGFLLVSSWKTTQKRNELNLKIETLRQELQDLEKKNAELKSGLNQTQSNEYLEQVARDQLNLKKPDEEVVSVQAATQTVQTVPAEKGFWQKLLEKLGF